jgi:hypothetical protein
VTKPIAKYQLARIRRSSHNRGTLNRTWRCIPVQESLAPGMEVQAFLPDRRCHEHVGPKGGIERATHVVGSDPLFIRVIWTRERRGDMTTQPQGRSDRGFLAVIKLNGAPVQAYRICEFLD